jgi:hypothetical protein
VSDAPANPKVPTADDTGNMGAIPVEAIAPGSIGTGAPNPLGFLVSDWVPIIPPLAGAAENAHTSPLGGRIQFLVLIR